MRLSPKERIFFFEIEICKKDSQNLLKSCLSFGGHLESSNEEKMGRQQKEEVL